MIDKKNWGEDGFNPKYIALFVLLAYGITWSINFPLLAVYADIDVTVREIWHCIGPIGPMIAAIIVLQIMYGKSGIRCLAVKLSWKGGSLLLLFALFPLFILLFSLCIEILTGSFEWSTFLYERGLTSPFSFLIFFLPSFSYGILEEFGWRGFLLPYLQKKFTAMNSTLILTSIWWLWHLPMLFYRYDPFFGFLFMFPLMITGSIVFTYLYNESGGSLLLVIILHVSYDLVSSQDISMIATILVSVIYIFMDIRAIKGYGTQNLAKNPRFILNLPYTNL